MQSSAHGGAQQLDAALAAALEAAAERVSQRVAAAVMSARLATAVHMRRAAESAAAQVETAGLPGTSGHTAAPVRPTVAAAFTRGQTGEGRRA